MSAKKPSAKKTTGTSKELVVLPPQKLSAPKVSQVWIGDLIELTETGLIFKRKLTLEEHKQVFSFLRTISSAQEFYLGDWIAECKGDYGEDSCNEIMAQAEFDFVRAMRAEKLAKIPRRLRNPRLTAAHHAAALPKLDKQGEFAMLLDTAEKEDLTPNELKRSIRAGRIVTDEEIAKKCPSRVGFRTYHAVRFNFDMWLKSCDVEKWTKQDWKDFLYFFKPIDDLLARARAEIQASV